jgi:hypothetical protein
VIQLVPVQATTTEIREHMDNVEYSAKKMPRSFLKQLDHFEQSFTISGG